VPFGSVAELTLPRGGARRASDGMVVFPDGSTMVS
jgi:hypothetical protein